METKANSDTVVKAKLPAALAKRGKPSEQNLEEQFQGNWEIENLYTQVNEAK